MSATGQFAAAPAFGLAIGKSPSCQCDGRRPADDVVVVSATPEKNHSPRIRIRVAVGSYTRNVTVYPVGAAPVCVTSGETTAGAWACAAEAHARLTRPAASVGQKRRLMSFTPGSFARAAPAVPRNRHGRHRPCATALHFVLPLRRRR